MASNGGGGGAFGSGIFLQGAGGTLSFQPGAGQAQTVSDVIADQAGSGGSGSYSLVKDGAGTLTLAGANTYSGNTAVNGGLVNFAASNNLGTGTITLNGGGLQWATGTSTDISARLGAVGAAGGTFDTNGNNVTLSSSFGGSTGGIVKTGNGTLTLNAVTQFVGATINGGTLAVAADNNLGVAGSGLTFGGGTLQFNAGFSSGRAITLNAGGGTFDTNGNAATLSGTISGTGGLTKTGTGVLTLSGASDYSGPTIVGGGTLRAGAANVFSVNSDFSVIGGTIDLDNFSQSIGALAGNSAVILGSATLATRVDSSATFGGAISGPGGGLTKQGGGTLTLNGVNTYTGATTIAAGTLALTGSSSLASSSVVAVNGGGTFDVSGSSVAFNQIATLAGGGTVQLGANGLVIANGSTEFSGTIADGGNFGGLVVDGGTQTLSGVNTYTGLTQIDPGATLALKGAGSIATSATVTFSPGGPGQVGTFDISQAATGASVAGLFDVAQAGIVSLGGKTLTLTDTAGGFSFNGVIQDGGIGGGTGGSVVLATNAVHDLAGVNTYTGSTTLMAGATLTLSGNGSIARSSVVNLAGVGATFDISGGNASQTIRDLERRRRVDGGAGRHGADPGHGQFDGLRRRDRRRRLQWRQRRVAGQGRHGHADARRRQHLHRRHDDQCRPDKLRGAEQFRHRLDHAQWRRAAMGGGQHDRHLLVRAAGAGRGRRHLRHRRQHHHLRDRPDGGRRHHQAGQRHPEPRGQQHLHRSHVSDGRHAGGERQDHQQCHGGSGRHVGRQRHDLRQRGQRRHARPRQLDRHA